MRLKQAIILLSLVIITSCASSTTQRPVAVASASPSPANPPNPPAFSEAVAVKAKIDACALLTSKEIEAIQGEAIKETKLTVQTAAGFSLSQCFFSLATFTNSISLLVAQTGEGAGAREPKDYWRDTFHDDKRKDKDKDRDSEKESGKKKGEEEEEGSPPQKVSGVGDEAYWTGSRVGGALYVLKGNSYLRISVGGPSNQDDKIRKSKTLARRALAHLATAK